VQAVFDYLGDHRGNFCNLMPVWFLVLTFQHMPALATRLGLDVVISFDLLYRNQLPCCALMAWLSPSLAFTLGTLTWLLRDSRPVARRRLGGIARVAVNLLPQGRHFCLQFLYTGNQRQDKLLNR
jgi:hypothetical protein